jgi:cell division septation protein DedD
VDTHVKERLTGAIILVGVLVLLVPELLTGPKRPAEPTQLNTDEPPLSSYTIDLSDDANASRASAPPAPNKPVAGATAPMGAASPDAEGGGSVEFAEPESSGETSDEAGSAVVTPGEDAGAEASDPKSGSAARNPASERPSENAAAQAAALAASKGAAEAKGGGNSAGRESADGARPVAGGAVNGKSATGAKPAASGSANSKLADGAKSAANVGGNARQADDAKAAQSGVANDESATAGGPAKASSPAGKVGASTGKGATVEKPAPSQSTPPKAATAARAENTDAPPDAKPAVAKAASGSGYAVQLGVFANRKNAERLATDLKGKGFSAAVSESKSGGKRLYKVRVGPEPDRSAAQALQGKLSAIGQKGSVVSAR